MKNLSRSRRYSVAHFHGFQVAAFQHGVLVTQLASRHNLASLQTLGISSIHYHLLSPDTVVLFHEFHLVNNLLFQEAGITWLVDFHLAHHLTNDDFKVLIINLHTLQTVNVLNLVHNIFLHGRRTFDSQDVRRCDSTVRQRSTGAYIVVLLNQNLLGQRYEVLLHFTGLGSNDDFAITAFHLTHGNLTVDF